MLAWISLFVGKHVALSIFQLLPDDAAGKVDVVVLHGELGQLVHVVVEHTFWFFLYSGSILVQLAHEHSGCSFGVLVGTMGLKVFLHLSAAVELVGGSKIAAFHLHKDGLRIYQAALAEVEVDACTQKFLGEHRHVETVGVVACKIASLKLLLQVGCQLLECRCVFHIFVADAGKGDDFFGYWHSGVYVEILTTLATVGHDLDIRHLDDTVFNHIKPRSLQVEDY